MTKEEWYRQLFERIEHSRFRSSFHLKQKDIDYINEKGVDTIREHARDFIAKREAPAVIPNDGKQTPMKGHPVFIAQHATATCCRECHPKMAQDTARKGIESGTAGISGGCDHDLDTEGNGEEYRLSNKMENSLRAIREI